MVGLQPFPRTGGARYAASHYSTLLRALE